MEEDNIIIKMEDHLEFIKIRYIIAVVVLVSCGPQNNLPTCDPIGMSTWTIGQDDLTCERVQFEVNLALDILERRKLATRTRFVNATVDTHRINCLRLHDQDTEGYCYMGTEGSRHIRLNWMRSALLHEMLHYKQEVEFTTPAVMHDGWDTNGYNEADKEFYHALYQTWYDEGQSPIMEYGKRSYYYADGGYIGTY